MSDYLWFLAVAIGPVLLGLVLAYALMKRRRLSKKEQIERDRATHELYRQDQ